MTVSTLKRSSTRRLSRSTNAPEAPMPGFVEPCDPTLQERAPTGEGWVYEIKTDGYRAQVHIRNGRVTIYSRSGYDWTEQFAPLAKAASKLKGLRDDLGAPVKAPSIVPPARDRRGRPHVGVPRENILQLLPDAVVPTKEELTAYWAKVHKRALEHLGHRPLKLVRHVHGTTFYHKGPLPKDIAGSVHQLHIRKREGGEGTRLWVDSLDGFLGLVAIGAVELHPWNATIENFERADGLVIDLDPGEGVPWEAVLEAALRMREILQDEGLSTWPKLTGGKGIHVMAPLPKPLLHDEAHRKAVRLVKVLADRDPEHYILSAQGNRRGRIFLDYLRNGRGTTAIGTYSPRVRPGFPIAAPVTWSRIEGGIRPDAFTMKRPFRARSESPNRPIRKRA
jgi:bifunctional non-homologous end joining protein LigD